MHPIHCRGSILIIISYSCFFFFFLLFCAFYDPPDWWCPLVGPVKRQNSVLELLCSIFWYMPTVCKHKYTHMVSAGFPLPGPEGLLPTAHLRVFPAPSTPDPTHQLRLSCSECVQARKGLKCPGRCVSRTRVGLVHTALPVHFHL